MRNNESIIARFALCTDTISLSSSSSRSSSPSVTDLALTPDSPVSADIKSPNKSAPASPSQRRLRNPFNSRPFLLPKTPSISEVTPRPGLLGGRTCSFLASNTRIDLDKDRGSPVLVQCRWFDSPVPTLHRDIEQEFKVTGLCGSHFRLFENSTLQCTISCLFVSVCSHIELFAQVLIFTPVLVL